MLLNKFSNKLLNLLLNLYSPCCLTEPFTLATSSATCCDTFSCTRQFHSPEVAADPRYQPGHADLLPHMWLVWKYSATSCRTCSATCGQCESTITGHIMLRPAYCPLQQVTWSCRSTGQAPSIRRVRSPPASFTWHLATATQIAEI